MHGNKIHTDWVGVAFSYDCVLVVTVDNSSCVIGMYQFGKRCRVIQAFQSFVLRGGVTKALPSNSNPFI